MLLTGKKNLDISYKDNLNFILDLKSIDNPTCTGLFGFEDFNFKVINNKLLDPENIFIDTIESGKKILLSGEISRTGYSYFLNNYPIAVNKNKILNKINNFYFDFESGFLNLDNLKFLGTFNGLEFYFPNKINLENIITGYAVNTSNENLIVTSGVINSYFNFQLNQLDTGTYLPNTSGKIIIETSGVNKTLPIKNFQINLNLFGSFGNISSDINFNTDSGDATHLKFNTSNIVYSNINSNFGENIIADNELYYEYITGRQLNGSNLYGEKLIELDLSYLNGYTGNNQGYVIGSGVSSVNFSGAITGIGHLEKEVNIIATGKNPTNFSNYVDTLTETISSDLIIVSGIIENQKVATIATGKVFGEFLVDFPIPVVLSEEKQMHLSNNVLGFGNLTGVVSGLGHGNNTIGSGIFYYASGDYFTGNYNHSITGIALTGIYNGNSNCYYINQGYYSGLFSGLITGSGFLYSNDITYNSTGILSGDLNARVLSKQVSNILSIPHIATGYSTINIQFQGFGLATGNYINTNIYGNIIEYTGVKNLNYTGIIDGTGFLITSGVDELTNKYGEKKPTIYIDFIPFQATGDVNNPVSPVNIINYNYSCVGTGVKLISDVEGILGFSTEDNIINLSGYVSETGLISGSSIDNFYKATGLAFRLFDNIFFSSPATGYIKNNSIYSVATGFTGAQVFNDNYVTKFYGVGTGAKDGEIYEEDHPRIGYITGIYNLNTGVIFAPEDSGVKTIIVTKPVVDFIENGVAPNLIRDFSISPPIVKEGSEYWVPSGTLTWANLPGDAETTILLIPNSGWTNCAWNADGSRSYNCGGSTYHTYELESGFNNWFSPPRTKMLTGYITLTGSGMMLSSSSAINITGVLISGEGLLTNIENLTGVDFDYVTGYEKNILKFRSQEIDGSVYSGTDIRTIRRTGNYSINLNKNITGLNYSQIEFGYTGLLTGQMNNILINNDSGYLYTGIYLEKSKDEINLNNFRYSNIDGGIYDLNLFPISNLSGSGFGLVPATGFFTKEIGNTFIKTNYVFDSGVFFVTGLNNNLNIELNYIEEDFGEKKIEQNITGFIKSPRILNENIEINNNQIVGTGFADIIVSGSGYLQKTLNIVNISGDIPINSKASGDFLNITEKEFYISGNAVDGKILYNNIVTGSYGGFLYTGYIGEILAVKDYNYNKVLMITGYLDNPLNYQISFQNSYSIATGYYNPLSKNINYQDLDFISGKYFGSGILPSETNILYIKTKLKEYKNQNPIEAKLSISGKTNGSVPSVINITYKKPEID